MLARLVLGLLFILFVIGCSENPQATQTEKGAFAAASVQ